MLFEISSEHVLDSLVCLWLVVVTVLFIVFAVNYTHAELRGSGLFDVFGEFVQDVLDF